MSWYTVAWLVWIAFFVVVEGRAALVLDLVG
jgi:hypothetical protein